MSEWKKPQIFIIKSCEKFKTNSVVIHLKIMIYAINDIIIKTIL